MATSSNTNPAAPLPEPGGSFRRPLIILAGALVSAVAAYLIFFHTPAPLPVSSAHHLPFGPEEQAYAEKLQFGNLSMSRAENFLHQEVTILSGQVLNSGDRPVRAIEVTVIFQDDMQQIVLRETRPVFAPNTPPVAPGQSMSFDISFDHVPISWNMQVPSVHVSGLEFAPLKR